jgi:hypothetical protein
MILDTSFPETPPMTDTSIAIGDRFESDVGNIYTVVAIGEKIGLTRSVAGDPRSGYGSEYKRWDWDITYWWLPRQVTAMERLPRETTS